jgi:hypothetical protein
MATFWLARASYTTSRRTPIGAPSTNADTGMAVVGDDRRFDSCPMREKLLNRTTLDVLLVVLVVLWAFQPALV